MRPLEMPVSSTASATDPDRDPPVMHWDATTLRPRPQHVYRTPRGRFFTVTLTQWQGEQDNPHAWSLGRCVELFETTLTEHELSHAEAFPSVPSKEA